MNIVDIIILAILAYYALRGFSQGIIAIFIELAGYVFSYIIALKYAAWGGALIAKYIPVQLPQSYQATLGLAVVWTLAIFVYYLLAPFIVRLIPPFISHSLVNKIGGVIGSVIKGLIFVSIILFILTLIPLPEPFKSDISNSIIAKPLIQVTTELEKKFGGDITNSIKSTISEISLIPNSLSSDNTTSSKSEPLIHLGYTVQNTTVDTSDENTMFNYVNQQRIEDHIAPLKLNSTLTSIARAYGAYMFANGFFSHITPSGQSPYDRVKDANVPFLYVGENIAKAPTVDAADTGFMNSPEHKANILDIHYTEVGIGVVNGGIYGKMYVQDFVGNQ